MKYIIMKTASYYFDIFSTFFTTRVKCDFLLSYLTLDFLWDKKYGNKLPHVVAL
jgi:hypothetical protein